MHIPTLLIQDSTALFLIMIPQRRETVFARHPDQNVMKQAHSFVPSRRGRGYSLPMSSNIVLIGFMGCGKSSIGRRLAGRLGHNFLDSDDMITARAGKSISEIFAEEGEERFREREAGELRDLLDSPKIVLATGGGAILRPENRDLLRRIGTVVWLHSDPDTLFERASRSRRRPLLQVENPRTTFNALLEERLPVYQQACTLKVDASGLSHEQTVEKIIRAIESEGAAHSTPGAQGSTAS